MPGEERQAARPSRLLTAWISQERRVVSFHPVPGYARFRTQNADAFWRRIRTLVEAGYRLQ